MNIQSQFYNAVNNSNLYEAEQIVKNIDVQENSNLYLITAVNRTDHQMLKFLLEHGADPLARSGVALTTAASKYDSECLKLLLPYFTNQKWDLLLDQTFQHVVEHHKTFQNSNAVRVCVPYASQHICNTMMVHAILSHKNLIIPVLSAYINATEVLALCAAPNTASRFTTYHTPALDMLKILEAEQQKHRIEEQLPTASVAAPRKL